MKGLNEVKLIGNLGSEPEMRFTPNGVAVTSFTMATSRKFKNDAGELVENTQWHNIICWNQLAENCNKSLDKGSAVFVSGSISYRQWEGQDGQKHYKTEIIAGDVIFLDKPKSVAPAPAAHPTRKSQASVGDKMLSDATEKANRSKLAAAAVAMGAEPIEEKLSDVLRAIDDAGLPF